ncbi:MAG TPA: NAD(P)-dependent oxidoreductase [Candidatus Nanoarchaeia archaeon]|nr:NAD(P)-dependent oxidoreductase [Candidatus Nanoarchaeia archaeon]
MTKKVLLLGHTGKVGIALKSVLNGNYRVIGRNSNDFDALDFDAVRKMVQAEKPDILINTVAFLGIDPCENDPEKAFKINTLFPKLLASLSNELDFLLVHFSTDAVFNDGKGDFYVESDIPKPLNVYGMTKYGGDCLIQAIAKKYFIFRISIMFGKSIKNNQFVEKMLQLINQGRKTLKIADDIISSPSYSLDVAKGVREILKRSPEYGIYHMVNDGKATLFDIMSEIVNGLGLDVKIEKASYNDFPFTGIKNTNTPIRSEKIKPLRPWKEAIKDYVEELKKELN